MKMLLCPMNGLRNISEFSYAGQVELDPSRFLDSDKEWADSLFFQYNGLESVLEWWQHSASGYWFIVERNRQSNEVVRSIDPESLFPKSIDYDALSRSKAEGRDS